MKISGISEGDNVKVLEHRDNEVIVIAAGEYRGVEYIGIRIYWRPPDADEFRPTKKGVNIPVEDALYFATALTQVCSDEDPTFLEDFLGAVMSMVSSD